MGKKLEKQDFKTRIKKLRDVFDQTQSELAEKVGIPRSSLANYEKGISVPSGDFISALKVAFNVNLDWFLTGEGEMFLEGQNAVENSEQYDEKTARIAELEEKIKALENQEARVKSLEAENKELEAENKQLSEDLLEMVRKFVIAPKAAKA